ncbi:T9SS type A sorting domain-containing protein [Polluticaenibacter yanchengensis]|uniref:T9SS type A sorting domain-containing protein n=1 Tax=Polluticaenibacter yanchengensis TaxID=3014562 RepID=A0ABT4ULW6_9BACT|nr:T9SS type A sorting domain-containing protein [Chitinophagaceae bacterium LY-5]
MASLPFLSTAQRVVKPVDNNEVAIKVKFYPNPVASNLNIELTDALNKGYTLNVFSFLGRVVHTQSISNEKFLLNVSNFPVGIYLLQVKDNAGKVLSTSRFQVSR